MHPLPGHPSNGLPLSAPRLWRQWTLACGSGEFLGIACAAGIAVGHRLLLGEPATTEDKLLHLFFMCFAGLVEGAILARFQWGVLRALFPRIPWKQWLAYTVVAAVIGWLLGMTPSLFMDGGEADGASPADMPLLLYYGMAALMGLFLGALFGYFQWLPLKPHTPRAILWIPANALGWAVGMIFIFLGASLPDESTPWGLILLSGAGGGLLGGLSVGAITGFFLLRLRT